MYRVLVATLLAATLALTGCTGSLRLGSSVPVVDGQHPTETMANV